jgi:membrane-associated protein
MFFDLIDGLLQALVGLSPHLLYLLTGVFSMLETSALVGLLVPGDAVVLLAGTTASSPARFLAVVGAAVVGSLAGESIGYLLGRRFGDRLRSSRLGRRLGERNWAKAEAFLNGRGGRAVFAARFVAVVHALLPVVAGTVRMPFRRFAGWAAAGSLAWSLLYVSVGVAAGASWRQYGDRLGITGYLILGVVVGATLVVRIARRRRPGAAAPADGNRLPRRPAHAPGSSPSPRSTTTRSRSGAHQAVRGPAQAALSGRPCSRR